MAWSDCQKAVARAPALACEVGVAVEFWVVAASCEVECGRFLRDVYFDGTGA